MDLAHKNVAVLASCQALLFTVNATLIALSALVGHALATDKHLATLPITIWVIGAALTTFFASMLMKRVGRRNGFTIGAVIGIFGALVCALAIYQASFFVFCLGTMILGVYNAFGQYYRFAAADASPDAFKSKAISYVLLGGLVGGFVGPAISSWTSSLLSITYLGVFLSLIVFLLSTIIVLRWLAIEPLSEAESHEPARPIAEILMQPKAVVAILGAVVGFGVMNLLMTATPLAMGLCGHPYSAASTVISWHIVGMFAPSFFTGALIKRFGVLRVMMMGVVLNFLCIGVALVGVDVANFWLALVLLGAGWNFLYIGGTTLLTEVYRPSEKGKIQGVNDLFIFITMAVSSFSSGLLLDWNGWQALNYIAAPFVAFLGVVIAWLMIKRRLAFAV